MAKEPKTAQVNLRLQPTLKEAAERAAAEDRRSLTSLVEILLAEHLKAKGYLKGWPMMKWDVQRIENATPEVSGDPLYAVVIRSDREPEWLEIHVVVQPTGNENSDKMQALSKAAGAAEAFAREARERRSELATSPSWRPRAIWSETVAAECRYQRTKLAPSPAVTLAVAAVTATAIVDLGLAGVENAVDVVLIAGLLATAVIFTVRLRS
jgi:hypothetical protein